MPSDNGSTNGPLDPMIHESSRLTIISVLNEGQWMEFGFLVSTTRLTKGNLSAHMAKLVAAGYVEESKEFVDRKPRSSYCLTAAGRSAFRRYRKTWHKLTGGRMD
jgi:DNA-binding MarR family transcriptional regulator